MDITLGRVDIEDVEKSKKARMASITMMANVPNSNSRDNLETRVASSFCFMVGLALRHLDGVSSILMNASMIPFPIFTILKEMEDDDDDNDGSLSLSLLWMRWVD